MKATEQYFPVVLFIMLYKVVLTFESMNEILKCDQSNESYWTVLSCGVVYYTVRDNSVMFEFVDKIHSLFYKFPRIEHWVENWLLFPYYP